ncbi:ABC transporter permease subunit [Pseudoalteromonas carrageenovora]|uniref:ABC transporter permease subunit n=1 Tax=Pseudoalteromonas carrageenovora TaxID=227 RepID=UPI0026E471AE|nr:ABC transporter permease subunit [Pseudoalteromonas carrageenovora]MDO6837530.1 ABC transporter permease subunit [Pseudoalteromonas carrageenovora]
MATSSIINIGRLTQIAGFELVRMFLTKRGLIAMAAFALVWLLILRYPIGQAVSIISAPNFEQMVRDISGTIGLSKLLDWPESEFAMYWLVALYSFPLFAIFISSDQTVGDRERGTLRFISLRATRFEILFGRFLGQLAVLACLLAITLVATLGVLGFRDPSLLMGGFTRALSIFIVMVVVLSPFVALMCLINTFARSSRLAIVLAILYFAGGGIIVGILAWQVPALNALDYIFPGVNSELLAGQNLPLLSVLGVPLIQSAVFIAIAHRIFTRSSL